MVSKHGGAALPLFDALTVRGTHCAAHAHTPPVAALRLPLSPLLPLQALFVAVRALLCCQL